MIMTQDKKSDAIEWLSAKAAGKLLGVSGRTITDMMKRGEIPGYQIGFTYKFKLSDVEQYLEDHRYKPGNNN